MKRLIAFLLLFTALQSRFSAFADDYRVFVLCNPKTPVNVRIRPKKGSKVEGRLDFGDWIETDGEKRNGWLHVIGIGETGEGWICSGYVVEDEPQKTERTRAVVAATGRVMSYRRIGGARNGWLNVGDELTVYALSDEWAVTNKGYVRSKYLDVWYE